MFRTALALVAAALFCLTAGTFAQEKKEKEVTLKGDVCCAKCELKESKKCHTAVRVKEDGKNVVYYFDEKSSKKYHEDICTAVKEATIVGTVSEKDGKKWVTITKLDWKKG